MDYPTKTIENAVNELSRLPGVGKKSALRLALFLLKKNEQEVEDLANSLIKLKKDTKICTLCNNLSDNELCTICDSKSRDLSTLCIVEDSRDLIALEKTHQYNGLYHVLGGLINPMEGIGPSQLNIENLFNRIENQPVEEIIFALNATPEGETTSFYISRKIDKTKVKVTSIARGVPVGGELEFTDEITLARSLRNRTNYLNPITNNL